MSYVVWWRKDVFSGVSKNLAYEGLSITAYSDKLVGEFIYEYFSLIYAYEQIS